MIPRDVPRLLVAALLCLAVAGCGGSKVTKANFEKVNVGMTEAEVDGILGKGEESASVSMDMPGMPPGAAVPGMTGSAKVKRWKDGSRSIVINFADGKVMMKAANGL